MAKSKSRFSRFLNPVLQSLRELGGSARPREVRDWIVANTDVSKAELESQHDSGDSKFENDVAWARFYLVRSGHVDSSRRGVWSLTEKSRSSALLTEDEVLDIIREVQSQSSTPGESVAATDEDADRVAGEVAERSTPEGSASSHRDEVLEGLQRLPPAGFERFCQRLLRESGFEQVNVTGRSGDGGIDGIGVLQINPFVSFKVLFQCKRYTGSVGSPQIRDFRGAMMGRADKGIILTTGTFTSDANAEAVRDGVPPIELVDGADLVDLLERLELGLVPRTTYDLDRKFFDEFAS